MIFPKRRSSMGTSDGLHLVGAQAEDFRGLVIHGAPRVGCFLLLLLGCLRQLLELLQQLLFFGLDVFTLTDGAVDQAIDDGYLTPPRRLRPNEEDWVPCLVDYANSMGISLCGMNEGAEQDADALHALHPSAK